MSPLRCLIRSPKHNSVGVVVVSEPDDLDAFTTQSVCLRDEAMQIPRIDVQAKLIAVTTEILVERSRFIRFPNRVASDLRRLAASASCRKEDDSCHAISQCVWRDKT